MNITKLSTITAALSATLLLSGPQLPAQDAPAAAPAPAQTGAAATGGGPGGGPGGRGGGQNWQQRMADRLKTELKATDDEWAVIQPLLQKVQEAQQVERAAMAGGRMMFGGGPGGGGRRGGGGNGGGGNPPPAAGAAPAGAAPGGGGPGGFGMQASAESTALTTALQSDATTNDDLKAKLQALRDARKKAQADLETARAALQKVLTLRQEAVLVNMGILD